MTFLGAKRPAIHCLYMSCRKFLGENLEECSIEELHSLEVELEKSLHCIRGRKVSYFLLVVFIQFICVNK